MKLLILYFSGAGVTKAVSYQIAAILVDFAAIDIYQVDSIYNPDLTSYDGFIVGTPVYHAAPAQLLKAFIHAMAPLNKPKPVFIFNTCGLFACNTNRILAKQLSTKNIIPVMSKSYRCPASDGILFFPMIKRFSEFEKSLTVKINKDCIELMQLVQKNSPAVNIPAFSIASIFNAPNQLAGNLITLPIYLHKDRCIKCSKCISSCPHNAIFKDTNHFPVVNRKNCENCYRCIHNCPVSALSLNKNKPPKKQLEF